MNTDNENRSEELNESELDSVAGGFSHSAPPEDGDPNDQHVNEEEANPEDDAPPEDGPIHV